MIEKEAAGHHSGSIRETGCLLTKDSASPLVLKEHFCHIPDRREVLEYITNSPGETVGQIQQGMGFNRGNPRHLPVRMKISEHITYLVVTGCASKQGTRFFPTLKGKQLVIS